MKVSCEAIDSGLRLTLLASLVHLAQQSLLAQQQAHAAMYCGYGLRVRLPNVSVCVSMFATVEFLSFIMTNKDTM